MKFLRALLIIVLAPIVMAAYLIGIAFVELPRRAIDWLFREG